MATLQAGALIGGRYELRRELARGGMGSVWEALHLQLEAPVAIKFMDPALCASDVARERFVREAKAAAQIRTPHVVHITDYGVEEDLPYIVMEMLSGEDLDERLTRGTLSLDEAEKVVVQAAKGLRKVHEAGTVHRDMKPSNLFLAGDGHEWVVKLIDFGVARAAEAAELPRTAPRVPTPSSPELTQAGTVLGSPQYMSPEQARGLKVDHQADVWALAAIAFRAVTGRRLFEGLEMMQILTKLCYEPLPIPSHVAPDLPPPLQGFFDRALHRDQPYRFADAMSLAQAFSTACAQVRQLQDHASVPGTAVPGPAVPAVRPPAISAPGMSSPGAPAPGGPSPDATAPPYGGSLESSGLAPRMPLPSMSGGFPEAASPARPTWLPLLAIAVAVVAVGSMSVVGVLASTNAGGSSFRARNDIVTGVTRVTDRFTSFDEDDEDDEEDPDNAEGDDVHPPAPPEPADEDADGDDAGDEEPKVPPPKAAPKAKVNRWGF